MNKFFLCSALFSGASASVPLGTLPDNYFDETDCPSCTVSDHKMKIQYSTAENCVSSRYCVDPDYEHSLDRQNHNYHHTALDSATTCTSDDDCTSGMHCHAGPATTCQQNHEHFHCTRSGDTCSCTCGTGAGAKTVDTGDGRRIHDLSADKRTDITYPVTTHGSGAPCHERIALNRDPDDVCERWTFVGKGFGADRNQHSVRNFRGTTADKNECAQKCEDTATCYGINYIPSWATQNCQIIVHMGYTPGDAMNAWGGEQSPNTAGPINALLPNADAECWRYTRHADPLEQWCPEGFNYISGTEGTQFGSVSYPGWCHKNGRCASTSGRTTVSWLHAQFSQEAPCRQACGVAGDACAGIQLSNGQCGLVWAGEDAPLSTVTASTDILNGPSGSFQGKIDSTVNAPSGTTCQVAAVDPNPPTMSPTVAPTVSPTTSPTPEPPTTACHPGLTLDENTGYCVADVPSQCGSTKGPVAHWQSSAWQANTGREMTEEQCRDACSRLPCQGYVHIHFNEVCQLYYPPGVRTFPSEYTGVDGPTNGVYSGAQCGTWNLCGLGEWDEPNKVSDYAGEETFKSPNNNVNQFYKWNVDADYDLTVGTSWGAVPLSQSPLDALVRAKNYGTSGWEWVDPPGKDVPTGPGYRPPGTNRNTWVPNALPESWGRCNMKPNACYALGTCLDSP